MIQKPLIQKIVELTLSHFRNSLIASLIGFTLLGCVGMPPNEDYALAYVAMEAAKGAGASKFASGYWNKCLTIYSEAEQQFEERRYTDAKILFNKARVYAERAENSARLKRLRSGEVF